MFASSPFCCQVVSLAVLRTLRLANSAFCCSVTGAILYLFLFGWLVANLKQYNLGGIEIPMEVCKLCSAFEGLFVCFTYLGRWIVSPLFLVVPGSLEGDLCLADRRFSRRI